MSLEAAILENTSVLRELLARLSNGAIVAAPEADTTKKPVSVASGPTTAAAVVADAPASTTKESPPVAASAVAASPASTVATEPATYEQVKPLILKINTVKGREAAAAALAHFGVAKGPELKAEQYAAFIAHALAVLS